MKKSMLSLAIIALLASCGGEKTETAVAVSKSESFHVYGNCGMCEKTIEGSLSGIDGIRKADWNKETKQIDIEFNESKITLIDIKNTIAGAGYDMDDVKAKESTYKGLPGCCQYDRPEVEKAEELKIDSTEHHQEHNH